MSISLTNIRGLVRYVLGDTSNTMMPGDVFVYGSSAIFTLSEPNAIAITGVFKNDVALTTQEYTFNATNNKITITATMTSGDTIEVQYTYYPNYSDTELDNYIKRAVIALSVHGYETWEVDTSGVFYPEPSIAEENLIAFIAGIIIEPNNESYRLPDVSITVPKDVTTTDNMISRAIAAFKRNSDGVWDIVGN